MGTNFYFRGEHVGKRSAAGMYCWDCRKTLCKGGEMAIHMDTHGWYEVCPSCGKSLIKEPLEQSSAGVELGFAKTTSPHKGVTTVASFTWAMHPHILFNKTARVNDEYGHEYTIQQFQRMLIQMCPIQYYHMIGQEFS